MKKKTANKICKVCGSKGRLLTEEDYKYTYGDRPKIPQYHLIAMVDYTGITIRPYGYYLCEEHYEEMEEQS